MGRQNLPQADKGPHDLNINMDGPLKAGLTSNRLLAKARGDPLPAPGYRFLYLIIRLAAAWSNRLSNVHKGTPVKAAEAIK